MLRWNLGTPPRASNAEESSPRGELPATGWFPGPFMSLGRVPRPVHTVSPADEVVTFSATNGNHPGPLPSMERPSRDLSHRPHLTERGRRPPPNAFSHLFRKSFADLPPGIPDRWTRSLREGSGDGGRVAATPLPGICPALTGEARDVPTSMAAPARGSGLRYRHHPAGGSCRTLGESVPREDSRGWSV